MSKYARAHDMDSWLRDPRIAERGFSHRWESMVASGNGEDAFLDLVDQHIDPESDLLDIGCGHGELTLDLSPRCRTIVGIDRDPEYIKLANELADERGIKNVRFFHVDMAGSDQKSGISDLIPLANDSVDLFVNRRGPVLSCYLSEAIRVARSSAIIVGLHPTGNTPAPVWRDELPEPHGIPYVKLIYSQLHAPFENEKMPQVAIHALGVSLFSAFCEELIVEAKRVDEITEARFENAVLIGIETRKNESGQTGNAIRFTLSSDRLREQASVPKVRGYLCLIKATYPALELTLNGEQVEI